jgi:hypothetical protein
MSFWPTKGNRQKIVFFVGADERYMSFVGMVWPTEGAVSRNKKKEKKNNAPLLALPNCRSASVLEP